MWVFFKNINCHVRMLIGRKCIHARWVLNPSSSVLRTKKVTAGREFMASFMITNSRKVYAPALIFVHGGFD